MNQLSFPREAANHGFDVESAVRRVAHWLPAQGPIKDFVHHNTLHAFQNMSFDDAICAAARLYGAHISMPGSFYLDNYKNGSISEAALDAALENFFPDPGARRNAKEKMLLGPVQRPKFNGRAAKGVRSHWTRELNGISLDRYTQPVVFKLIGGFLDQGLSIWRMPGADQLDFFNAVVSLTEKSWLPLGALSKPLARKLLRLDAVTAIEEALKTIVGDPALYETYILEMLLAQPGWAGFVNQCEHGSGTLLSPRNIRLLDFIAVSLVVEASCLQMELGGKFKPLKALHENLPEPLAPDAVPSRTEEETFLLVWQNAFEWTYYDSVLGGIVATASRAHAAPESSSAWAFFCIDDRECSLRRHIEEVEPRIETFATAGFFGLDFMYRGAADSVAGKHCPVPVKPKHLVIEEVEDVLRIEKKHATFDSKSNTFFRGWVLSHALGFGAALRLAASVFRPSLAPVSVAPLSTVNQSARLRLSRKDDAQTKEGLWIGYSVHELADRVRNLLESVGVEGAWPELVVFFGHGSSSVNNPYFAAYNCGACSGRPGAPNARAFAEAANMPEVRAILRSQGFEIPERTWFIGALHDTSLDEVTYFDVKRIPERLKASFDGFKRSVDTALEKNAAERCRRFDMVPDHISPPDALSEVKTRSISLFEPRPEYNHATNASCIIGRRSLTEGIFLDRRAFLSSYDPTRDPGGTILSNILSAVIPVCGGINLEYFFSRVDPWTYGAGTKLSQNVSGLVGVINGIEGDLLTGLPTQMTEIHDPIRLMIVVEQSPEVALAAVRKIPENFQWISNGWIRFGSIDPATREVFIYKDGKMKRIDGLRPPNVCWRDSLEAAYAGHGNLPMGYIKRKEDRL